MGQRHEGPGPRRNLPPILARRGLVRRPTKSRTGCPMVFPGWARRIAIPEGHPSRATEVLGWPQGGFPRRNRSCRARPNSASIRGRTTDRRPARGPTSCGRRCSGAPAIAIHDHAALVTDRPSCFAGRRQYRRGSPRPSPGPPRGGTGALRSIQCAEHATGPDLANWSVRVRAVLMDSLVRGRGRGLRDLAVHDCDPRGGR